MTYRWTVVILGLSCVLASAEEPLEELPAPRPLTKHAAPESGQEIVRERHADGRIAVERHVSLDSSQNYVNHGPYLEFDESGAKRKSGQYQMGRPVGLWTVWYQGHETQTLQEPPYAMFKPPFISQATFRDGELDGAWTIFDGQQQKVSEISFAKGRRSGPAVWWYPNGGKMRELAFVEDRLQGAATFYRPNGQVARRETYEGGHRIQHVVQKHPSGAKMSEGVYRHPRIDMAERDNFWDLQFAMFEQQGEGTKEGEWVRYYPNGQKQMVGVFQRDKPIGQFTWWYESGQRALTGVYEEGDKVGQWTWWHDNGMKRSQGNYREGNPAGLWASWDEQGTLIHEINSLQSSEAIASGQGQRDELPSPGATGDLETIDPPSDFVRRDRDELHRHFSSPLPVSNRITP
ncbi:MAG: toxin-antitoxin system YwqK family antitoxin [Planctomycetales bacterium]|nr:toxin-antitoxin system YwqK family antitoxin [Planctomycetales bacterium]